MVPFHVFIWHRVSALLVFKSVYFLIMSFENLFWVQVLYLIRDLQVFSPSLPFAF